MPLVVFAIAWELLARSSERYLFLFGSPLSLLQAAREELPRSEIWIDTGYTALSATLGLVIGWLLGTVVGVGLWVVPVISKVARPYLAALAAIPIFALAPMLIIWFGVGLLPKVVMAAFPVFLGCAATSFWSARSLEQYHGEWLAGLGVNRWLAVCRVIVPEVLNRLVYLLRDFVGVALVGAFIGEFVSSRIGLGRFILRSGSVYDMPRVLLGVTMMIGISAAMIGACKLISRAIYPASGTHGREAL